MCSYLPASQMYVAHIKVDLIAALVVRHVKHAARHIENQSESVSKVHLMLNVVIKLINCADRVCVCDVTSRGDDDHVDICGECMLMAWLAQLAGLDQVGHPASVPNPLNVCICLCRLS